MLNLEQEKFCMQEFKSWLEQRFPDSLIDPPHEGNEPPDFWLRCNGSKYAVEITRILHEPDQRVTCGQWKLLEEVEKDARDAGELCGEYVLEIDRPLADRRGRNELKRGIRDYVKRTKSEPTARKEEVRVGGDVICGIRKYSGLGADIFPVDGGVDFGGWTPDIQREVAEILRTRLEAKAKKLAKLDCPIILVLDDCYQLAMQDTLAECLRSLPQMSEFHTVYVVQDKNVGFVVTTLFPSPVGDGLSGGECPPIGAELCRGARNGKPSLPSALLLFLNWRKQT